MPMTEERLREVVAMITERCSCPIQDQCELCTKAADELRAHADELAGLRKDRADAVLSGVLIALGCVYLFGAEGAAEEIVGTVGADELLRVAKAEEDCYLPQLENTISFLRTGTYRDDAAMSEGGGDAKR